VVGRRSRRDKLHKLHIGGSLQEMVRWRGGDRGGRPALLSWNKPRGLLTGPPHNAVWEVGAGVRVPLRAVSRMTLRNAMNELGLPSRSHVTNGAARV